MRNSAARKKRDTRSAKEKYHSQGSDGSVVCDRRHSGQHVPLLRLRVYHLPITRAQYNPTNYPPPPTRTRTRLLPQTRECVDPWSQLGSIKYIPPEGARSLERTMLLYHSAEDPGNKQIGQTPDTDRSTCKGPLISYHARTPHSSSIRRCSLVAMYGCTSMRVPLSFRVRFKAN